MDPILRMMVRFLDKAGQEGNRGISVIFIGMLENYLKKDNRPVNDPEFLQAFVNLYQRGCEYLTREALRNATTSAIIGEIEDAYRYLKTARKWASPYKIDITGDIGGIENLLKERGYDLPPFW